MKSVTITVGDYDLEIIEQIFEKESAFSPQDPRDELMIELMRQIKDNPKVDLGADEAAEYEKAKTPYQRLLESKELRKKQKALCSLHKRKSVIQVFLSKLEVCWCILSTNT